MKSISLKMAGLLAALVLAAGSAGPLFPQPQKTALGPVSGVWVNTSYNVGSAAALLILTEEGVLRTWDQSYDTRCAGESRCTVSDAWSDAGYTYMDRIWYRQRPSGLTPDMGYAALDREM